MTAVLVAVFATSQLDPCKLELEPIPGVGALYSVEVVEKFGLELNEKQLANLQQEILLSRVPGEKVRSGVISFLDPAVGKIVSARFATAQDEAAFRSTNLRGLVSGATEERVGDRLVVRGRVGKPGLSVDLVWVYSQGIVVYGESKAISKLNLKPVQAFVQDHVNSDYSVRYHVLAVPKVHRRQLLSEVSNRIFASSQQRDAEQEAPYRARRAIAQTALLFSEAIAEGVESITLAIDSPMRALGAYGLTLDVRTREDSALQEYLSKSVIRRPKFVLSRPDSLAGWAELHLALPPEVVGQFKDVPQSGELLYGLLSAAADGRFEAAVGIKANEPPHLFGVADFAADRLSLKSLPLPESSLNGETVWSLGKLTGRRELETFKVLASVSKNRLWADVSKQPESEVDDVVKRPRGRVTLPLLAFSFDLARLTDRNEPGSVSGAMLRALENLFDAMELERRIRKRDRSLAPLVSRYETRLKKHVPKEQWDHYQKTFLRQQRSFFGLPEQLSEPCESVLEHSSVEGDWAVRGSLRVLKNGLAGRIHIGRELHQLFRARRLMVQKRIMTSER